MFNNVKNYIPEIKLDYHFQKNTQSSGMGIELKDLNQDILGMLLFKNKEEIHCLGRKGIYSSLYYFLNET